MSTPKSSPILTRHGPREPGAATASPGPIVVHSSTTRGNTLTLALTGEIDLLGAGPLRAILCAAVRQGVTGLVLDTSRVTFADSALLRVLDTWPGGGRRLRLVNRSRAVQRLLDSVAPVAPVAPAVPVAPVAPVPLVVPVPAGSGAYAGHAAGRLPGRAHAGSTSPGDTAPPGCRPRGSGEAAMR
ncbi:STAS domain-containing protein [Streptomyces subrutilus]|uniref:STAS domain-containing protein n=1 Tax=Streptomyces subrutilus TaxID=36818 RepID=UPI00341B6CC0